MGESGPEPAMSQEVLLAILSLAGGAAGAKVIDMWGKRQQMAFDERRATRDETRDRVEQLEKKLDFLTDQVAQWQSKYLVAQEHVLRCESELTEVRARLEKLERVQSE